MAGMPIGKIILTRFALGRKRTLHTRGGDANLPVCCFDEVFPFYISLLLRGDLFRSFITCGINDLNMDRDFFSFSVLNLNVTNIAVIYFVLFWGYAFWSAGVLSLPH